MRTSCKEKKCALRDDVHQIFFQINDNKMQIQTVTLNMLEIST